MSGILIVTPAPRASRLGNRVTAQRWASILRSLGHRVDVAGEFRDQDVDLLIALHARKSAASVALFARRKPDHPIVLALTGTDLYRDIHTSKSARRSLELANSLVLLQPHGQRELPPPMRAKARVIYQSATAPAARPDPLKGVFEICVSGHLRHEKDPLRAALAARRLPANSTIRITHIGAPLSDALGERARAEMKRNPRYRWLGEVPRWKAGRLLSRSRLLVLSSRMEGGANVISEALAAGVPVVASRISGSLGLLGEDYPGFFEVGDTRALALLMHRCERDAQFYRRLRRHCRRQRRLVKPSFERSSWQALIDELLPNS